MAIVMMEDGMCELLNEEVSLLNTCHYRLYTNAVTLDGTQVLADFDEPTDSGYVNSHTPAFGACAINGDGDAQIDGSPITWTFTHDAGSFNVVGMFCYNPATGKVLYAEEREEGAFPVTAPDTIFILQPRKVMGTL